METGFEVFDRMNGGVKIGQIVSVFAGTGGRSTFAETQAAIQAGVDKMIAGEFEVIDESVE